MRSLFIALVSLLALPVDGARRLSAVARDVPAGRRSHHRFNLVGLHWQGSGEVSFRTKAIGGRWSGWRQAAPEDAGCSRPGTRTRPTGLADREPVLDGSVEPPADQDAWPGAPGSSAVRLEPAGGVPPRSISVADSR